MWDSESNQESNGFCIRCGVPLWDGRDLRGSSDGCDHRHMTKEPERDAAGHLVEERASA